MLSETHYKEGKEMVENVMGCAFLVEEAGDFFFVVLVGYILKQSSSS